eukprot:366268-Chlamydomonas_euryale.AAC.20
MQEVPATSCGHKPQVTKPKSQVPAELWVTAPAPASGLSCCQGTIPLTFLRSGRWCGRCCSSRGPSSVG